MIVTPLRNHQIEHQACQNGSLNNGDKGNYRLILMDKSFVRQATKTKLQLTHSKSGIEACYKEGDQS